LPCILDSFEQFFHIMDHQQPNDHSLGVLPFVNIFNKIPMLSCCVIIIFKVETDNHSMLFLLVKVRFVNGKGL
jgi:hypothetical protein